MSQAALTRGPVGADRRRGALLIIVGPDGVGKTTIARELAAAYGGPTAYFHFVPPVREEMSPLPPEGAPPHLGKGTPGGSRVLGWLRLARNVARFWVAYLTQVRPALARGTLVVGDRGAYGYLVQPYALKFYGPSALARALLRALPQPDLVVNLTAPPEVIRTRKQELTPEQIVRELREWAHLPVRRLRSFDTTDVPSAIAARILHAL